MTPSILSIDVQELVQHMCKQVNIELPSNPLKGYQLDKSKMGFRIFTKNDCNVEEQASNSISEIMWKDSDGSPAFAKLYANAQGLPFELDIWKLNYSTPQDIAGWKKKGN